MTYDSSKNFKVYLDGEYKFSKLDENDELITLNIGNGIAIGADYADKSQSSEALYAAVRVYNRALSADEIKALACEFI